MVCRMQWCGRVTGDIRKWRECGSLFLLHANSITIEDYGIEEAVFRYHWPGLICWLRALGGKRPSQRTV